MGHSQLFKEGVLMRLNRLDFVEMQEEKHLAKPGDLCAHAVS